MKSIIVLLSLALVAAVEASPLPKDDVAARIVGGQEVTNAQQLPWQAMVLFQGSFVCGGIILDDHWVLTAAHCVTNRTASQISVRVGTHLTSGVGGRIYRVEDVEIPDGFQGFQNDVALLDIHDPIQLGPTVRAIPIAESDPAPGETVIYSGFGRTSQDGPVSTGWF